ncbi:hypothetical protein [Streptomyces sp. NPDC001480]|uniref:hypothetical protein n=1 Tax=Streptomyces sp. NPDC001480 TaxID=3364577 RepID=UPI0036B24027
MKSLKAAAVLAGSLIAASVAGPAFAAEDVANTGFSGTVNTKLPLDVPLHQSDLASGKSGGLIESVKGAANALNDARPLHHSAKDAREALQDAKPLHGGLSL